MVQAEAPPSAPQLVPVEVKVSPLSPLLLPCPSEERKKKKELTGQKNQNKNLFFVLLLYEEKEFSSFSYMKI